MYSIYDKVADYKTTEYRATFKLERNKNNV